MAMDIRDEIAKRRRENWFEVRFVIEALAIKEDALKSSLVDHVAKLSSVKDVFVYEKEFSDVSVVDKPTPKIREAFSQLAVVKFFAKDLRILLNVVLTYGPSAVEILGPEKRETSMSEIQDVANNLAALVHQFAAAGMGGILITPEDKAKSGL